MAAYAVLNQKYPGFGTFTGAVTQPQNIGKIDYDALLVAFNKRFSQNYSARVSYTLSYSRGNTSGNGVAASGFQVLDDMNLDLNEGPGAFDTRHNLVLSGQALVPRTGGLNVSWVVRALSGSPFTLTNNLVDPDRTVPYTDQITAGYERQIAGNMAVSADYVHAFSRDLLMSKDLNAGLRATTASTSPVVRNTP